MVIPWQPWSCFSYTFKHFFIEHQTTNDQTNVGTIKIDSPHPIIFGTQTKPPILMNVEQSCPHN